MTLIEKIVCYGMIALAIAICVFMFVHTIIEIRKLNKKLNKQIAIIDIIKDGKKVGQLTIDKNKTKYGYGDCPIKYDKDEQIVVMIEKGIGDSPYSKLKQHRSLIFK